MCCVSKCLYSSSAFVNTQQAYKIGGRQALFVAGECATERLQAMCSFLDAISSHLHKVTVLERHRLVIAHTIQSWTNCTKLCQQRQCVLRKLAPVVSSHSALGVVLRWRSPQKLPACVQCQISDLVDASILQCDINASP